MIKFLRKLIDGSLTQARGNAVQTIGSEYDTIVHAEPSGRANALQKANQRCCIVTSVRNEGLWMLEWVAHYRSLGVDAIVVYANDNTDSSDDLLNLLAHAGVIYLRRNETAAHISPQMKAFRYAFWLDDVVAAHEWVGMLDADELFVPAIHGDPVTSIGTYLDYIDRTYGADAIAINWKWFGGDRGFARKPGMQMRTYRSSIRNSHIKTLFKLRHASGIPSPHHPAMLEGATIIGGGGQRLVQLAAEQQPAYDLGQINHYWQRSFQEYYLKKHRGRGGTGLAGTQRSYADFFEWWQAGSIDDLPTKEHVSRVAGEIERLLRLPGVTRAMERIEASFRVTTAAPDVRAIYDSLSSENIVR